VIGSPLRVLVVTVVHDPRDARVYQREIRALVEAGDSVTFAAPFSGYGAALPTDVTPIDLPRALGRSRAAALRAARRVIAEHGPQNDLVLLHDPELLVAVAGLRLPPVVWDVHEDTAAALSLKSWLPEGLRPVVRRVVAGLERHAEGGRRLILAEPGYAGRFIGSHPVVPNTTPVPAAVPEPGDDRAVYLGRVTRERGGADLVEVGRLLAPRGVVMHVIGPADGAMTPLLEAASSEGVVRWQGFVANDDALRAVEGAAAGLSLLHDEPNYRHSTPTKVVEYMARGVPVVSTPLPEAERLIETAACGLVVPFARPAAAAEAVLRLVDDAAMRRRMGAAGHAYAQERLNWTVDGASFVRLLHDWAARGA